MDDFATKFDQAESKLKSSEEKATLLEDKVSEKSIQLVKNYASSSGYQ